MAVKVPMSQILHVNGINIRGVNDQIVEILNDMFSLHLEFELTHHQEVHLHLNQRDFWIMRESFSTRKGVFFHLLLVFS